MMVNQIIVDYFRVNAALKEIRELSCLENSEKHPAAFLTLVQLICKEALEQNGKDGENQKGKSDSI